MNRKYFYDRLSQLIGVNWFAVSLFAVSYRGPGFFLEYHTLAAASTITQNFSFHENIVIDYESRHSN